MEMVGLPKDYVIALLKAACFNVPLEQGLFRQACDHLRRLEPRVPATASLEKPTGTAETIVIDKTLEQASSVSAAPSWTVSRG